MIIRFLKPTPYTPKPDDSPRCWGQLRIRPTTISEAVAVEVTRPDGTTETVNTTLTKTGPMERYFPAGATPDLTDDVAAGFVAAGLAELVDQTSRLVSGDELAAMVSAAMPQAKGN